MLNENVKKLILILELDEKCLWTEHFKKCQTWIDFLIEYGFTQEEINLLTSALISVYGKKDSFNDYIPVVKSEKMEHHLIPNIAGNFEYYAEELYSIALILREIDNIDSEENF